MSNKKRFSMLVISLLALMMVLVRGEVVWADPTELFFSEYVEGSSYNKALEIYNGTGVAIDLSTYAIELYSNGASFPSQSATLSGTLADGDVYIIAHPSADSAILAVADATNGSVVNFNGDDAVTLKNGGMVVDVIGQVGYDPGSEWGSGDVSTADNTIRRRADVCAGDTDPSDTFDPSTEWDGFDNNTFDGLGVHTANCGTLPDTSPSVASTTPNDGATSVAVNENIGIQFSEDVTVTGDWFGIGCTSSGSHTAVVSGDLQSYTLNPDSDFANGETCTVTVFASLVTDQDDTPDNMTVDYTFSFTTVTAATGDWVINEIHADPDDTNGDANGDGTVNIQQDEFVEIVNNSDSDMDISGWTLADGYSVRHTFPAGTVVSAHCAIVVFAGGSPTGAFGGVVVQTASTGQLGLNNGGDTVTLNDGSTDQATVTYGSEGGDNQSLTRDPDITGLEPLVKHSLAIGSGGVLFSPGTKIDSSLFAGCTIPDIPPFVSHTTPTNGAAGIAVDATIDIQFSEDVTATGDWFDLSCTVSGPHSAIVGGGPQNYMLDPDGDFINGETCTVTILAAQVTDQDGTPDNMSQDHVFSFNTITDWIINEIHADPADDLPGDANGDGVRDSTDDEFVEIVNSSNVALDISGWSLSDAADTRHTFPVDTVIPGGCAIVVFGGGTPTGDFGNAVVQTATSGSLSLNNSGDTITLNNGTMNVASLTYGSDGGDNQSLTRDPDIAGPEPLIKHSLATGSGGTLFSPGTQINGSPFFGCTCGDPATLIHDVQGNGDTSPLNGASDIVIEGVVVGDFQDTATQLRGFFLQEEGTDVDADPMTSEGIFVYDPGFTLDVNVDDVVRVMGDVTEYRGLTELGSISNMTVCNTGIASAATIMLPVPSLDIWEQHEGMLINIPQTLYVTDNYSQGRYGEVGLSADGRLYNPTNVVEPGTDANDLQDLNDRSRIQLDDGSTVSNPLPLPPYLGPDNTLRAGDTIPGLTGVLGCYYDYEVHPTQEVNFTRVNTRDATPPTVGGTLKVASFNVLNYFSTIDPDPSDDSSSTPDNLADNICGPAENLECRGADSAVEFSRQRDKIIEAIVTMDADVIGLMEMENHPSDVALQNLVEGLNDKAGAGTYSFINTGPIGTDAIKVAFIYKLGMVEPVGPYAILDGSVDPTFNDQRNRPALAQTFKQNSTEARFTVVVNHLKSKGTPCTDPAIDDPLDPDIDDGQGNCNLTRTAAANALTAWLVTDPTGSGDPDFLIIGDLNAYAMEDPIDAIKDAGYTNLIEQFIGADAYSYVYYGQSGYLDHALSNTSLTPQVTGVIEWHINADEPAALDYNDYNQPALYNSDQYRASDHDPVLIDLDLKTEKPTAVSLVSFKVEVDNGQAVIGWETGTEIDNAGFNLYRSISPDGPWFKLNTSLIVAEGDPLSGASYTFVDTPGRGTFYYRLEDVDYFGLSTQHNPVMAELGAAVRAPWFQPSLPEF